GRPGGLPGVVRGAGRGADERPGPAADPGPSAAGARRPERPAAAATQPADAAGEHAGRGRALTPVGPMTRVLVYEYLCSGAEARPAGETPWASALSGEGWAILAAAVEDFRRVPGVEVLTLLDERRR